MYRYDSWLENLRIKMTEKECPVIANCYKCNEELYDGDIAFFDVCSDIYLCDRCVSSTEEEDEEEFQLISENFEKIKLEDYNIDFFEDDKYEDWGE